MAASPYRICAAPRNERGYYCASKAKTLFVQSFRTETLREKYWNYKIVPATVDTPGAEYEYVMCDFPTGGKSEFVSERRYADTKLLKGTIDKFKGV